MAHYYVLPTSSGAMEAADMFHGRPSPGYDSVEIFLDEDYNPEARVRYSKTLPNPPGAGNVKRFDIPSGLESLSKKHGVDKAHYVVLVYSKADRSTPPVVPFDPGHHETFSVSTMTETYKQPECWTSPYFPLVFDSGCPDLYRVCLLGMSGIPQTQMDKLVALPELTSLYIWDSTGATSGLHVDVPKNASNMGAWALSFSDKNCDNFADDWGMPTYPQLWLMEGFRSVPDNLLRKNNKVLQLVVRNCGLETESAQEIVSNNIQADRIDISGNTGIRSLPFTRGDDRCYHMDGVSFARKCKCEVMLYDRRNSSAQAMRQHHELAVGSAYGSEWSVYPTPDRRLDAYGLAGISTKHYPTLRGKSGGVRERSVTRVSHYSIKEI